jgi:hypothetical protein
MPRNRLVTSALTGLPVEDIIGRPRFRPRRLLPSRGDGSESVRDARAQTAAAASAHHAWSTGIAGAVAVSRCWQVEREASA